MFLVVLCVLLGPAMNANCETHSLTYIYTALSEGAVLEGTQEFTAMGVLDGHVIDYYDSGAMRKVPKQAWMGEELNANYWQRGSESRQSKQRWFKVNMDILLQRMRHNRSDVHVLQWLHGCHGDLQPDYSVQFRRGVDRYSYDGRNFLSFDYDAAVWVAASDAALETKRKWDEVQMLKDYTRAYLDKECIIWMSNFLKYERDHLSNAPLPGVHVFARTAHIRTNVVLTCLATGFYHKNVTLEIRRNSRTLTKEDGMMSSGLRPNEDDTFQRRDSVEVLKGDMSTFTCVLRHQASGLNVEAVWDHTIISATDAGVSVGIIAGLVALLATILLVALVLKLRSRKSNGGAVHKATPPVDSVPKVFEKLLLCEEKGTTHSLDSGIFCDSATPTQEVESHTSLHRLRSSSEDTPTDAPGDQLEDSPVLPIV
ncbi:H-2 class I histocompatibility antigen, L-D alpha chain-like isoform X2 [Dunckerocampus dactyliophorus]|uniref:H-2 class I histocompatibility antigen, L-D alpha chain-like isoform X2 n=1 Tax=Dunckerocampus dactyliophorus TaxID=161453 RepID=UPI002404912E|nr:H-2 class I histocompatibility antigen, L-D alpha chain-like isoform X2 [Dunckerocampus dactyliophorus]